MSNAKKRVWMINIVSYIGTSLHLDFYLLKPYVKKCFINLFVSIYLVEHRLNSVVEVSGLWTADPEFKSAIGFCSYSTIFENNFLSKIANFFVCLTHIPLIHHGIYNNQANICWFEKLFQSVVNPLKVFKYFFSISLNFPFSIKWNKYNYLI